MKTRLLLFIFLIFHLGLRAQSKGWGVGAYGFAGRAGFGYAAIDASGYSGSAYQLGALSQYNFGNRLAGRIGLGYGHAKGSSSGQYPNIEFPGYTIYGDKYEAEFKHTDILVPLELLLDLGKKYDRGIYAIGGLTFGVPLKRYAVETTYSGGNGPVRTDLSDNHPAVDVYSSLGLGYAFQLQSGTRLYLQFSGASNALSNLFSALDNNQGSGDDQAKVEWYGLGLGVMGALSGGEK